MVLSGNQMLIGFLLITLLLIVTIFSFRFLLQRGFKSGILKKKKNIWESGKGVFRYYNSLFGIGLIISLCLVILSFSWTMREIPSYTVEFSDDYEIINEPDIQRTIQKKKLPTPPIAPKTLTVDPEIIHFNPEPTVQETDEALIDDPEEALFQENKLSVISSIPEPAAVEIIIEDDKDEKPFDFVERRPLFPGCDGAMDIKEREICADRALLKFLSSNIRYPSIARENGIEGICQVLFIVEKDGSITAEEIIKDIGGGCGDEALRVIKLMAKNDIHWKPGLQNSRTVRVRIKIPVKFVLQK